MRASDLLNVLEPLLPLPALEAFCDEALRLHVGHTDDADAAVQARSLRLALGHLAQAPRLWPLHRLEIDNHDVQMSYGHLSESLSAVAGSLQELFIGGLDLGGAEWGALAACLPQLQVLELWMCLLPGDALASLVGTWPSLAAYCTGVSEAGWLGLAAGRTEVLVVSMQPTLEEVPMQQCQALQEELFGRRYITFDPFDVWRV